MNALTTWVVLVALYGTAAWLIFKNLGDQTLRLDEARTALLARQIIRTGRPRVCDRGQVPCFTAAEYNREGLAVMHTWLQYYLTALSFRLFGQSAGTARLPFALFGLMAIPLCQALAAEIAPESLSSSLVVVLLASSTSYLLMVRQARYYSLAFFFQPALLLALLYTIRAPGPWAAVGLAAAGTLLFYSDWALWVSTVVGAIAYFVLLAFSWVAALYMLGALALMSACILPWRLYLRRTGYPGIPRGLLPGRSWVSSLKTFRQAFPVYFWKLHVYFFPLVTLAPAAWLLASLTAGSLAGWLPGRAYWLPVLVILADLAAHSFTTVLFTRYIAGTLIPAAILSGGWLGVLFERQPVFGVLLMGVLVLTNVLHLLPYWIVRALRLPPARVPFLASPQVQFIKGPSLAAFLRLRLGLRSFLFEYISEITHHYETRTEGLTRFLALHAGVDEVVLLDRMEAPPLAFHLGAAGRIDLTVVPYGEPTPPELAVAPPRADWLVTGGLAPGDSPVSEAGLDSADYEVLDLPAIDLCLDNTETLDRHHFRTLERLRGLTVYHRVGAETLWRPR